MNATRRVGLALGIMALLSTLTGCGGEAGVAMSPAKSPGPAAEVTVTSQGQPSSAPAQPGYYGGGRSADMSPPPPAPREAPAGDSAARAQRKEAESRPGLGTEWGETRFSRISTVPFVRNDPTQPFATSALFYNDEEGARAMASNAGFKRWSGGQFSVASNIVSIGLRDERGGFLSGFIAGGKNYIVGEAGHRYTIVVRNNTDSRLEIVLSVDGLDVLDGKPASFSKRGYLIDPRGEVEVDGFRQSMDTVAAFRFGSVRNSYAGQKTGDTSNVGVIGMAVFNERGTNPFPWTQDEVQRRQDANPFPGQFATPP
ncbi:MAG: hypothetical protein U0359_35145 [Byssovorax sp.]